MQNTNKVQIINVTFQCDGLHCFRLTCITTGLLLGMRHGCDDNHEIQL